MDSNSVQRARLTVVGVTCMMGLLLVSCDTKVTSSTHSRPAARQFDPDALRKLLIAGLSTNSVRTALGLPDAVIAGESGDLLWAYNVVPTPAVGDMSGTYVIGVDITLTNGAVSYWTCAYQLSRHEPVATNWSDLPANVARAGSASLRFFWCSQLPFEGSQYIDTIDLPQVGYVSAKPELEVTELAEVLWRELPAGPGIENGASSFSVSLNPSDGQQLAEITKTNLGGQLVIFAGSEPVLAPVISMPLLAGSFEIRCAKRHTSKRLAEVLQTMPRCKR